MIKRLLVTAVTVLVLFQLGSVTTYAGSKIPLRVTSVEADPVSSAHIKQVVADYQSAHPDVEITLEFLPLVQLVQRSLSAAASGDSLGVQLSWAPHTYELAVKGLMEPVDDVIDSIGRQDFIPATLLSWQNRTYLVPYFRTGNVLYIRTDLFKEKGLKPPKTWDEFLQAARALTEKGPDGKVKRYGIVLPASRHDSTFSHILPFIWMKGGSIMARDGKTITWNSPAVIETLKWWKELAKNAPPGIGQYGWGDQMQTFYSDAVAMSMYGGRLLQRVREFNPKLLDSTLGVPLPTPTGDPKEFTSFAETAGIAIMKGTPNLAVAKDFVKFFMTGDRYMAFTGTVPTHFVPTKKSVINDPRYWQEPFRASVRPTMENIINAASVGKYFLYEWEGKVNVRTNIVAMSLLMSECIQEILLQNAPVEQTVAKYGVKMQALADSIKD